MKRWGNTTMFHSMGIFRETGKRFGSWAVLMIALFLVSADTVKAQAVRFDGDATTVSSACASGKQCQVLSLPGTQVNFCSGAYSGVVNTSGTAVTWVSGQVFSVSWTGQISINGVSFQIRSVNSTTSITLTTSAGTLTAVTYSSLASCLASPATTYTNFSAMTTCSTTAQLTPQTGGACTSTADLQGGYGAWLLPGQYSYYLRVPATAGGGTYGPYPINIGASEGCILGATCDADYQTFAAACTAAGAGTLYVTRVWPAVPSQTAACTVAFLGNGKIVTATSATVAFTGPVICPTYQQCFDTTTNASSQATFTKPPSNINPVQWGAIANGTGATGTDGSEKWQAPINALNTNGGGSMSVPFAPLCYWAHGIIIYSNISINSENQLTCVQKPAGNPATITQVFTTNNSTSGGAAVSNIHISNLTIDGNQANQAGISPTQEGLYGIFLGGCSNCSVEGVRLINHFIDGMQVGGYGATTVTGVMAITNPSTVITGATWASGTGLYTFTSAAFTLASGQETKITGVNPSGYNINCFVIPVDSTHFSCTQSNADPGAYVSGGIQTSYLGTWSSGTNFAEFAAGITLYLGAGGCVSGTPVTSYNPISATVIGFSVGDPAPNASIAFCAPSYVGVGSGVTIRNNYFSGNRRWGIAHLAGPNTLIEDNYFTNNGVAGYGNGGCIDVEPYQLGSLLYGSQYNRNQCYSSYARGINIIPNTQKDESYAPIAMGNTIIGTTVGPGFYAASSNVTTKPLTLSGTFLNNFEHGIITNWEGNTTGTSVAIGGSTYGWSVDSGFGGSVNILGGSISGSSFDVSNSNFSTMVVAPGVLANNTFIGKYFTSMMGVINDFAVNCVPVWANSGMLPRLGVVNCVNGFKFIDGTNPLVQVSDGTVISKLQALASGATFIGSQTNHPVIIGANNATGTKGSLTVDPAGHGRLAGVLFSDLPACSAGTKFSFASISDSSTVTWGATITGGGGNIVEGFCNGTNWTVYAK